MRLTILHTNDLHGKLTPEKAAFIRQLKAENEPCLYFDSGDCVKAGNLAIPLRPDPAWTLLAEAGCDAGTLGNRETHVLESGFRAKLAGVRHPLLIANLRVKSEREVELPGGGLKPTGKQLRAEARTPFGLTPSDASSPYPVISSSQHLIISSPYHPFPGAMTIEEAGMRVGVIGAMVPMVTERMKTAFASAYLWDAPIPAVVALAEDLSLGPRLSPFALSPSPCDLLIALTHIGVREDRALAEACPELDMILGGHSHTVLDQPEKMRDTWICQGGSHGRYVGRYVWEAGAGLVEARLVAM